MLLGLFLFLAKASSLQAQTKVLNPIAEGAVDSPDVKVQRLGSFAGGQFTVGSSPDRLPLRSLRSLRFKLGLKYLREIIRDGYSMGAALSYINQTAAIDTESDQKRVFDTLNYEKEMFRKSGLQVDYLHRIRITGYEVSFAAYVELGVHAAWFFNRRYIREVSIADDQLERTEIRQFADMAPFQYGVSATMGYNQLALLYTFRLSDYFEEGAFPELPAHYLGLQIGL